MTNRPTGTGFLSEAAGDGRFARPDVVMWGSGIDPSGVSDSTTAIQAKINAVPVGGVLFVPNGTYKLTSDLIVPSSMTIRGASLATTFLGKAAGGTLNHPMGNYFSGAVFQQDGAGKNGFTITASGVTPNFENIGIRFTNASTGHGIYAATNTVWNSAPDSGPMGFHWRNVMVYNHDGNHYAYFLLNPIYFRFDHVYSWGGGGLWIEGHGAVTRENIYGNAVFTETFFQVFAAGTAHGIALKTDTNTLNLMTFVRPQVLVTDAANTQGTQALFIATLGTYVPLNIDLIDPDLEAYGSTCPIDFGGVRSSVRVRNGGVMSQSPVGGYNPGVAQSEYYKITATGTWTCPQHVKYVRVRAVGAGGGGGGGGSTSNGTLNQSGGGGGGAGMVTEGTVQVTPGQQYTVTIGAGGTAGAAATSGGAAGGTGGTGGPTSLGTLISANGGAGGGGSAASSTAAAGGGIMGRGSQSTTLQVPGNGAPSQGNNGNAATPIPPGVVGGGAGGAASSSSTLGGGGGTAALAFPVATGQDGGTMGASTTTAGVAGTTATAYGCGGGGGGGGAVGGGGGGGGAGAPGLLEIWV